MDEPIQSKHGSLKRSALRAAGRGWPAFPVYGIESGECTCGNPNCDHPGKHPLTAHGVKDATTDEARIRRWWRKSPEANVGIATGRQSGLVVFDIDPMHGGLESLEKLERENGPLPDCPRVRTGSGGHHLYFRHPGGSVKSRVGILPGIDIRADGAYVVGPGSLHKSGRQYLWLCDKTPEKIPVPPLPDAFLRLVEGQSPSSPQPQPEPIIPQGQRNSTLTSLAGVMRYRGMTQEGIEAALLEENRQRCDPPLPDTDVIGIARSIARYQPGREILSASYKEEVQAERKTLRFRTGKQIATETPDVVPWLVPPFVALGAITEIDGKVKLAGKTTFAMHIVKAASDGSPFLDQPTTKSKAVYLSEQPIVSLRAAMERARLLGRKDFTALLWSDTVGTSWNTVAEAAIEKCKRSGAKLLIVDTLAQFAGLVGDTENNAGDALKALRPLQEAAAEGIAVIIVRHERKSGGALGDSGRGSSAFAGAVDIIISLRRPEGNHPRSVRLLQAVSRFDSHGDLLIELTNKGYRPLGTPGEGAKAQATTELLSSIPKAQKKAATISDLIKITSTSRAQLQKLLDALGETGEIERCGKGRKGNPYRYFKP